MAKRKLAPTWNSREKRWRLPVQQNGSRKWFSSDIPGRSGRLDCIEQAEQWLECKEPAVIPLVSEAFSAWLDEVNNVIGSASGRMYEMHGRLYILPIIGGLRADRLDNEQIFQRIINNAYKNSASGKPLAKQTLRNLRATISGFLKYCRKCGYTSLHIENMTLPRKATKANKQILQPHELQVLFSSDYTILPADGKSGSREWFIHAYRFAVSTGLRPGETLGLQWDDITGNVCRIQRSFNNDGELTDGKNENARRTIVLTQRAMDALEAQREQLSAAGITSAYVFPASTGEPPSHRVYERHLEKYCRRNGIGVVSPYELRHTFISLNKGLPPELIKGYAGHSESMDTFGVYGHEVDGEKKRTADLIDGVLSGLLDSGNTSGNTR